MISTVINVGKNSFVIKDNSLYNSEGELYSRNFQIGGHYSDCVNVSVSYTDNSKPNNAKISTIVYDEECSLKAPLLRGEGTIIMIKTLLRHINKVIPEIKEFIFEDKSNIECGTEEEKHQKRLRKRGTYARPLVLYYFSIAFNCGTWYEKNFNAYQHDIVMHKAYRERVKELLMDKTIKPSFNDFLRIAQPQMKYLEEIKKLYEESETYEEFFNSMPKDDRCRLVRDWITTFMEYYLKGVFKNSDWVIDVEKMDNTPELCKVRKNGGRRITIKKKKYYYPKEKIRLSLQYHDMGI